MIEEEAEIIALSAKSATLQTQPKSGCSSCHAQNSCGQGLLSKYFNQTPGQIELTIEGADNYQVGDRVVLGIEENAMVAGAFYAYMLPLLGVVIFAMLAQLLNITAEWQQGLIILSGLFLSMSLSRWLISGNRGKGFKPVLLRKTANFNQIKMCEES